MKSSALEQQIQIILDAHDDDDELDEINMQKFRCTHNRAQANRPAAAHLFAAYLALLVCCWQLVLVGQLNAQISGPLQPQATNDAIEPQSQPGDTADSTGSAGILPAPQARPKVQVNVHDWTRRLSEEIRAVSNRTGCLDSIGRFFEKRATFQPLDPIKTRDSIINQIGNLLSQHRDAVSAIVAEAERFAASHVFSKTLRFNYTDVHRLRNELDASPGGDSSTAAGQLSASNQDQSSTSAQQLAPGQQQVPQFTSIAGGTPVPGPPEWQTPVKTVLLQVNKNFGDIPVNTSMSAVHLPLPIYAGLPQIMNGIAWTERLDSVFKRNLANYMHVHHQYYGDQLGFLRTFPAHKWRIARTDPDLFDARTRPWYSAGVSSPKDVVILIDTSGSMTGLRREIAKGVVFEILDTLTNSDYFSVLRFSENVTPVGLPKCNLRTPRMSPQLDQQCSLLPGPPMNTFGQLEVDQLMGQAQMSAANSREPSECAAYRRQWETRGQYLRDHPNVVPGKNGSYLTDELYRKSIVNVTAEISDAYLLPASSRNIRYLKGNFSMPTAGIANFTNALMAAFELLQAYNRSGEQSSSQCNQLIMLITDGAIRSHEDIFNRLNYPNAPVRLFTYMIGREVGDISHTKAMACSNRGYYTHVINLSEVREQVLKYLPVLARPMVLAKHHPISWTYAYGDETHQVLTDWVLETKRRERARIMLNEERERLSEANSTDVINIELTNIPEYDEIPLVDEELKNRIICEDPNINSESMGELKSPPEQVNDDPNQQQATLAAAAGGAAAAATTPAAAPGAGMTDEESSSAAAELDRSLHDELDPLGYNELGCHWSSRKADLLTSVVKPVFDLRNTSLIFERVLQKNIWNEKETHVRNAQLLGVASVDLRISDMIKLAPSHMLGPNGYAILLGHNGFVLHHPDLRALLEDPFDKQSRILKPYFNAVDLSHIEQVFHKNDSDPNKKRADDSRLFKLREASVRRQSHFESLWVKRAVDCRRRVHIRQQVFYYAPIKDTPYTLMLALPQNYGLNKVNAKLELDKRALAFFTPSAYDLWTVHPDYKYCELAGGSTSSAKPVETIMRLMDLVKMSQLNNEQPNIVYADLNSIELGQPNRTANRIVCDKELFPALIFDAAATYESSDSFCNQANFDTCLSSSGGSSSSSSSSLLSGMYSSRSSQSDESCARNPDEMRSKLANIYGLEMSFVATQSGLTRVRVFDLTARIKKLADLFMQRHSRTVDEPWYARTVDWNMRFQEDATIITAPYNAYIRLVAKLRQRITQRHPAMNDTRANCDPMLDSGGDDSSPASSSADTNPLPAENSSKIATSEQVQNDDPLSAGATYSPLEEAATIMRSNSPPGVNSAPEESSNIADQLLDKTNYAQYSSFDFLDLLVNSSVHLSATQTVIANRGSRQRTPVAVSGLLYDYATFARRFFNLTSLKIHQFDRQRPREQDQHDQQQQQQQQVKIDICPNADCPTKCGLRNDTIDCLLVDNNGFIVVGEELPYIGRSLVDYDEKLMLSLVERRLFHPIQLTDYQAICARPDANDAKWSQTTSSASTLPAGSSSAARSSLNMSPIWSQLLPALMGNLVSSMSWLASSVYALVFLKSSLTDMSGLFGADQSYLGQQQAEHLQFAYAQSAVANQSLLAMLPNKTYLRPCEKSVTLYETRPIDPLKLSLDTPEYYETKCGCSGWYVYDLVPNTNLIMLIVNTTSACRRCEAPAKPADNFVPLIVPAASAHHDSVPVGPPPNKTAEDQVCAMLERDAQLYVRRQETCYAQHPEEANIHLCGGANQLAPTRLLWLLALLCSLTLHLGLLRKGER